MFYRWERPMNNLLILNWQDGQAVIPLTITFELFYLGKREWFCSCVRHHIRIQSHQYACSSNHNKGKRLANHNMITCKRFTNHNKCKLSANRNIFTYEHLTTITQTQCLANHIIFTCKCTTNHNKGKHPASHTIDTYNPTKNQKKC